MGWRYLLFILGGITLVLWGIRIFAFDLLESPRYLIGKGKDEEAVAVIHKVAAYNKTTSSLTVDQLTSIGQPTESGTAAGERWALSKTSNFTFTHIKSLFRTRKIAYSTSLLISIWGTFLSNRGSALRRDSRPTFYLGIIGLASTLYNNFLPFL